MSRPRVAGAWVEALQASGRYSFTKEEAEAGIRISPVATQSALRRLKQAGRITSPSRGFYVVVPPEYGAAGCPPASWFIDDLMRHLGRSYYVGILTAAQLHGAGHQQPMVFQVVVEKATRPMQAGRVRIELHTRGDTAEMPAAALQTETGTMRVGSPETTAFDLVQFFSAAGHWNNVATVLTELADKLDSGGLVQIAPRMQLPVVQRLGYLLGLVGEADLVGPLADWLSQRRTTVVRLRTDRPKGNTDIDRRWRLIPNEPVETDL